MEDAAVRRDRLIAAAIAATPLLMPFYFDYDQLLLAIPAVLLAAEWLRGPAGGAGVAARSAAADCLADLLLRAGSQSGHWRGDSRRSRGAAAGDDCDVEYCAA